MSEPENVVMDTIPEDAPVKITKPRQPKKEISPERKAALLEQLKKARAKAAENRAAKKAAKEAGLPPPPKAEKKARKPRAKKVKTAVAPDTDDELIQVQQSPHIIETEKKAAPAIIDGRDAELKRLRDQVANYTLQDIARNSKPQPKRVKPRVPKLKDDETFVEPKREAEPKIPPAPPIADQKLEVPTPQDKPKAPAPSPPKPPTLLPKKTKKSLLKKKRVRRR